MSNTQTVPDAETLSKLEFDLECGCRYMWQLFQRWTFTYRKCHSAAMWVGVLPCCSRQQFFCQTCASQDGPHKCGGCGRTHENRYGWRWQWI